MRKQGTFVNLKPFPQVWRESLLWNIVKYNYSKISCKGTLSAFYLMYRFQDAFSKELCLEALSSSKIAFSIWKGTTIFTRKPVARRSWQFGGAIRRDHPVPNVRNSIVTIKPRKAKSPWKQHSAWNTENIKVSFPLLTVGNLEGKLGKYFQ